MSRYIIHNIIICVYITNSHEYIDICVYLYVWSDGYIFSGSLYKHTHYCKSL